MSRMTQAQENAFLLCGIALLTAFDLSEALRFGFGIGYSIYAGMVFMAGDSNE